jgi:hypothetical protein
MEKRLVAANVCLSFKAKSYKEVWLFYFLDENMAELDDKELQRYENLLLKAQQYKIPERK